MATRPHARWALSSFVLLAAVGLSALGASSASAHGFTSTVYADAATTENGDVQVELDLEYDLLVVSAAESGGDDAFFERGMDLFETGDEAVALHEYADTVNRYVFDRFEVSQAGEACTPSTHGDYVTHLRDVPYATVTVDYACPADAGEGYEIRSSLFPDEEQYVTGTTTVLTYDIDGSSGSAALDAANPAFSTGQTLLEHMREFFLLGAEHLLTGIDHILFLVVLIIGSWRLRDVVLAATTFTIAHSITFLLAAIGVVSVPGEIVEPVIALSIAIIAGWYIWGAWRRRTSPAEVAAEPRGRLKQSRSDWLRLAVVFAFGLIHGLGFAGALGLDEPWSWTLLWSLLVFNVGIEVVQLAIIAVLFPVLILLRRVRPRVALWAGLATAAVVTVVAMIWFVERLPIYA
jgi:hydrogenase/urease accessory protein HupE